MRCGSRVVAGAVVTALLAACGEGGTVTPTDGATHETHDEAARRAATPAASAVPDATAAAVERLADEWGDPPEDRSRDDVVRDLAALGAEGLERLIVFAATDPDDLRELVQDVAEALGDDAVPVFAKVLREQSGTARWIAACDVPDEWPWLASGPEVARALLVALEDESEEVRRTVLGQLGHSGPTGVAVTEAIVRRLDAAEDRDLPRFEEGDTEADAAFDALKALGPDAASAFGRVAQHAQTFAMFPEDHSDVLAAIGPATEEDRRLLLTFLRSDDPARRLAASACFTSHPDAARGLVAEVLPHLAFSGDDDLVRLWNALGELAEVPGIAQEFLAALPGLAEDRARHVVAILAGSDLADVRAAARAAAVQMLRSRSPEIRESTIHCLSPREGDPFDPAPLRPLLDDPYAEVRAAAAWILCTDPESEARAMAVAREVLTGSGDARLDAAKVLALEIDEEEPPADWVALLADDDSNLRRIVAENLARETSPLGSPPRGAIAALVGDALREDPWREAARVVVRFEGGAEALLAGALDAIRSMDDDAAFRGLQALAAAAPAFRAAPPEIRAEILNPAHYGIRPPGFQRAIAALTGELRDVAAAFGGDVADARRLLEFGEKGARELVSKCGGLSSWATARIAEELRGDAVLCREILAAAGTPGDTETSTILRRGAARLADALPADQDVSLCVQLAADPHALVRLAAVESLDDIAMHDNLRVATDALRAALSDEDDDVRREACGVARHVSALLPDLRERLGDRVPVVRLQAATMVLWRDASDDVARRTVLDVLAAAEEEQQLYAADWRAVGPVLRSIPLDASAARVFAHALREVGDCESQGEILRALPRLGTASAPALESVRLALANELGCAWGYHDDPLRPDAIAALAAMGAAAAPALPDLRAVATRDREHAEAARAAIRAIEAGDAPR